MEGKISSGNVIAMEKNCDKHKEEIKLTEKCRPVPLKKEKSHGLELQNSVQSLTANKEQDSVRQESVQTDKNRVLKRKVTEDGVTIERVLSEGEASSGFETVSSINSDLDLEDFQLSSSDDESDYNVIVRIENELAYQQSKKMCKLERMGKAIHNDGEEECESNFVKFPPGNGINVGNDSDWRRYSLPDRRNGEIRCNSGSERLLCNYSGPRHGIVRSYQHSLHWKRLCNGAFQRYDWTDSWSKADEYSRFSRRASCDREWSRFSDHSIRSRESRCIDQSKRYRGSLYTDDIMGKSKKKKIAIHRENSEPKYELIGSKSLSYEIIKREYKHSKSFHKSKSCTKRILESTRQTASPSSFKSPSTSIWKRLDGGRPRKKLKKNGDRSSESPSANPPRKKERTPFLVELERKLKEAKKQSSVKVTDSAKSHQNKTQNCVAETAPRPEAVMMNAEAPIPAAASPMKEAAVGSLNPNYEQASNYAYPSSNPHMNSAHYVSFPNLSLENLPLVAGPTGLPVHITPTGEQIFHDMDGRRIPIGHNGHYLPLDPTGRLFAHIVSPGNQAVPIHMTEDGILRLPNSEPVPYGPSHNLPVNIDGRIIYIGPDSRPLDHYPNLPRQPPLHLMQMTHFNDFGNGKREGQERTSVMLQICQAGHEQTPGIRGDLEGQYSSPSSLQAPISSQSIHQSSNVQSVGSYLLHSIPNLSEKTNRADVLMNYQIKVLERREDILKCQEIEKNFGVSPSKGGVKRSIPTKLSQKKTCRDENDCDSNSTDSNTSESAIALKSSSGAKKDKNKGVESNTEDLLVRKIRRVLKSLDNNKFKPPALGRFIISEVLIDVLRETSPNGSPLLKNRVKLPFLTPNASNCQTPRCESKTVEKAAVIFSFLSREKSSDRGEKAGNPSKKYIKNLNSAKLPVFTFDSAVQCDLTSKEISKLNTKIVEVEKEVVRLQNINANLRDGFRNVKEAKDKKSEELGKALLDIEKRNIEILTLKRLLNEKRRD